MRLVSRLTTLARLGPHAVLRVARYRFLLKAGRHPVQQIRPAPIPDGPFFTAPGKRDGLPAANERWGERLWWFDWYSEPRSAGAPDWHHNPFGTAPGVRDGNWWTIPDFAGSGDVKGVWELSRFGWLVAFATQAARGDGAALATINAWLASWSSANPAYVGTNWKCGQEAAIRVMHLLTAAVVLDQDRRATPALVALVRSHLARIGPTMSYALGQDNNHGTSEAAAMFAGGAFLAAHGQAEGAKWAAIGRRWLNERACRLIMADGGFSQYSLTYHRVMLDTYVFIEAWRQRHGLPPLDQHALRRLAKATDWLDALVEPATGDAPNLGANDGARLLPLTNADYRDFRPTLAAASAVFRGRAALPAGPWDAQLDWLGISRPSVLTESPERASTDFASSGFMALYAGRASAYLRYPRFRFRPSQADLLHLDLWVDGHNLMRDAGTYSYADDLGITLAGTAAHNSVTFDDRDQMPRLGRFLFGAWPRARDVALNAEGEVQSATAAFTDDRGMFHRRSVRLKPDGFTCIDEISGPFRDAVLRWRLLPGAYRQTENGVAGPRLTLSMTCDGEDISPSLVEGVESRYYLQRDTLPVLETKVSRPCRIVTTVRY